MRTIQTNLYTFDELSPSAKEKALEYGRNLLGEDPPCLDEHSNSYHAANKFFDSYDNSPVADLKAGALSIRGKCYLTGYWADEYAIDGILEGCELYDSVDEVMRFMRRHMNTEWDKEVASNLEDENVSEFLMINGYEFTESGKSNRSH